ncbi:MAG: DUF3800 domain-containing protein [Bacillota bacterium]
MHFCFIDESGYPIPGQNDTHPVLAAVCFRSADIGDLTKRLHRAEIDSFGEDPGGNRKLKGKDMISERSLTERYDRRLLYVNKLMDVLDTYESTVFAVVMERPDYVPYQEEGMLPWQYRYLLDRLQLFGVKRRGPMLLIFDKVDDKKDGALAHGFKGFLFKHLGGKHYQNIIEMPLFVSSINTPFIRFPDFVGNAFREYYGRGLDTRSPNNDYEKWITELASRLHAKTVDFPIQGRKEYGVFRMSKDKFPKGPKSQ